jgi:hypothetical protein
MNFVWTLSLLSSLSVFDYQQLSITRRRTTAHDTTPSPTYNCSSLLLIRAALLHHLSPQAEEDEELVGLRVLVAHEPLVRELVQVPRVALLVRVKARLGKGVLEVEPAALDEVGVDAGPGADEAHRVVDDHVLVPQIFEALVRLQAVRLNGRPLGHVLLDEGDDALMVPPLDHLQHDAAALLLADDAQDPDALAPLALVILALAHLGLVDLFECTCARKDSLSGALLKTPFTCIAPILTYLHRLARPAHLLRAVPDVRS